MSMLSSFWVTLASGLRCLGSALAASLVQSQQPFVVGSAYAVTAQPAPALALQGVWSQSFVPSLLLLVVELPWGLFCGFLSPWPLVAPYPSVILACVSSFGIYSGLGLRCCGPGFGSSLVLDPPFFWGGSLSLVLVVLAWLLQLFHFVQVTGFLDFLLGFSFSRLPVFAGSSEWVETYVSVLSCLLFGCVFVRTVFCEQLLLASAFEATRSCLALVLRFFLVGLMVRTRCPSISRFRLGFSFPSFGSGGASFGDIF